MSTTAVLQHEDLEHLLDALTDRGYTVVGPTARGGTIVLDELSSVGELPAGWTDLQEAGTYRLERTESPEVFGHVVGPHSMKRYLHPPEIRLWSATTTTWDLAIDPGPPAPQLAFLGVRPCDVAAVAVQDKVFTGGPFADRVYGERRTGACIIAVNCTRPGGTCFCASMGTGPAATGGFDLSLTELADDDGHRYLVTIGSELGGELVAALPVVPADPATVAEVDRRLAAAEQQMGRVFAADGAKETLQGNPEARRWDETGERCLGCTNCTMVCPTCFCATVEDETDLTGKVAWRTRRWDSCFTHEFSYIHGGPLRLSGEGRYRQWLTHKLASWHDQFGSSGCVGCGRCITWCPVGIDIIEEVEAIREEERRYVRS